MNTCLKYILGFLLGSWLFTGCHYADMLEFNDIPRVSFVGVDKNGSDTYDPYHFGCFPEFRRKSERRFYFL